MSKKNSNVILKNIFRDFKSLEKTYYNFEKKLNNLKFEKYAVAVSGGPDSLALVALTKNYSLKYKKSFKYVLVDHGIRPKSTNEAEIVKKILKEKKIPLKIIKNKIQIKKNIQKKARDIRYELISEFCMKNKIKILLTAHTLEDQVETFLIRLSRGSGLTGLSSMSLTNKIKNKIILFRPLLDTKKKDLINITKKAFNKYIKDPSNVNKKYLRTKIRKLRKPLSDSGIEYNQIIKSINNLASSKNTLDIYFKDISKEVIKKRKNEVILDFYKFNNCNNDIKMKLINYSIKIVKKNYYDLRGKKVLNLIKSVKNNSFKKSTLGGCVITKRNTFLSIKPQ